MIPTLTWIDFSEQDRQRMMDVVQLFRERGTRDELGIGSVRDAFSNLLFPGTSTIQTRARYFLFVPWIMLDREGKIRWAGRHDRKNSVETLIRRREVNLIEALEAGGESDGVIGIEARADLQRMPSSIYWNGLGSWQIRLFPGSSSDYYRRLERFNSDSIHEVLADDGQPVGDVDGGNWHPAIPDAPDDFLDETTFVLRQEEAVYLKERILASHPGTLLAQLVADADPLPDPDAIRFPWLHPDRGDFPERLQAQLGHARRFSVVMHGAALLYNLMIVQALEHDEWTAEHRAALTDWCARIRDDDLNLDRWDLNEFWTVVASENDGVARGAQRFIERWIEIARRRLSIDELATNAEARDLIRHRERTLKGGRARLVNDRRLELFGGSAGTGRLDYRWGTVRRIVQDILIGLHRQAQNA